MTMLMVLIHTTTMAQCGLFLLMIKNGLLNSPKEEPYGITIIFFRIVSNTCLWMWLKINIILRSGLKIPFKMG